MKPVKNPLFVTKLKVQLVIWMEPVVKHSCELWVIAIWMEHLLMELVLEVELVQ